VSRTGPSLAAVLAVPEFRALWFAEAQSVAGDQLAKVALAILVYDRTNSALWAAAVYALTFLPALAGGLGLAQLADRVPRRLLIIICTALQALLVGLMAIPGSPLAVLCVLVVAVNLIQAPALAAQNALTRELFEDDELYLRSQDLRGMTTNTVMLAGLAGGGLLVMGLGTSWALALDAVTFAVSTLVVYAGVRNRPVAGGSRDGWFGAARRVFGDRRLRLLLAMAWLVGLVVVPEGLAAPLARELGAGSAAVGWLLAADPFGFVLGTFVLSHFVSAQVRVRVIGMLTVGSVGTLIAFALRPNLAAALVLLALAGALGAYHITASATFNTMVPNEIRGGAIGLARTGLRVSQGVGVALGGLVAELLGSALTTVALAGALGVLIAVPAAVSWARIGTRDDEPPHPPGTNGKSVPHPDVPTARVNPDPIRDSPKVSPE
jgi:predicted MFS family arabinose efflux permease